MRYVLVIRADENADVSDEVRAARAAADASFLDRWDGLLVDGRVLQLAAAATTVRCWDGGDIIVTTGPCARAGEQITGYIVVDCADLDAAIDVATKVPAAWYGDIEIREERAESSR